MKMVAIRVNRTCHPLAALIAKRMVAIFLLLILSDAYGAVTVTQTGVASPQSKAETNNVEKLRARAIRNAMDLAVLQVTGALVSGERTDTLRSRERIAVIGENVREETKQESRYRGSSTSRSMGHVRLLEIVKEWREGTQYYVKVKVEVGEQKEVAKSTNAGFYWNRMGKPPIGLSFSEKRNERDTTQTESYTLRYLRDNLSRNGVIVTSVDEQAISYLIHIIQEFNTEQLVDLGTYTTHCRLTFRIVDQKRRETIAEHRSKHGPDAGFTVRQAEDNCIKSIAPSVSKQLIRTIARVMNEQWNNGEEFLVTFTGMPGQFMPQAVNTVQSIFRVKGSIVESYRDNVLQLKVQYKGQGVEFTEAVIASFDDLDQGLVSETIQGRHIRFRWIPRPDQDMRN